MSQTPTPRAPKATEGRSAPVRLERLGRYRIVRPLSAGGMALVFEGRRESLAGVAPRVAIKLILPEHADSDTFRELFINEARLGASMQHQNLVQIQDFDQDGENFFLVMEYVEGITLRQVVASCLKHDIPIPLGVVAEIGRQACDGLHYAHQATDERGVHLGLVHRDVKPSNLMLNPQGVVKILDFGISKGNLLDERSGAVRGTWGYMAPEQASARSLGPNADVFGLATILYEMASRKPLFRKKSQEEIRRLLDDDHAARMAATLPSEYGPLVGVLVRALQRDPAARYATAADFGRALSALLPDPITARDEVVRFYRSMEALEQGRGAPPLQSGGPRPTPALPGPGAATSPSNASLAVQASSTEPRGFAWGWLMAGIAAAVTLLPAGAAIGLWWTWDAGDEPKGVVLDLDAVEGPSLLSPEPPEPPAPTEPPPPVDRPPPVEIVTPKPSGVTSVGAKDASPEVPAAPPPEAPVVVKIDRRATDVQIVEVQPPAEPEPPEPVYTGVGWLTLSALPYGTEYDVFVDGKLVTKSGPGAPILKYEIPAGEHFVTISAANGARKQFELTVNQDEHVRKAWDFERNQWRR